MMDFDQIAQMVAKRMKREEQQRESWLAAVPAEELAVMKEELSTFPVSKHTLDEDARYDQIKKLLRMAVVGGECCYSYDVLVNCGNPHMYSGAWIDVSPWASFFGQQWQLILQALSLSDNLSITVLDDGGVRLRMGVYHAHLGEDL